MICSLLSARAFSSCDVIVIILRSLNMHNIIEVETMRSEGNLSSTATYWHHAHHGYCVREQIGLTRRILPRTRPKNSESERGFRFLGPAASTSC